MSRVWKIFRAIILTLAFVLIALPVSLYVILSTDWAQQDIRKVASNELSAILGSEVSFRKVEIHPFNRLSIYDITANDDNGDPALEIDEISVAYELFYLLRTGKLVVDFAIIDSPTFCLSKQSKSSPLNIAGILKAMKSKDGNRPQSRYDLTVNTVVLRKGIFKYDVFDCERRDSVFDPNHISISDIFLNAYIPRISNDRYRVDIDHFSFIESNGFTLSDFQASADIDSIGSKLETLDISLPGSRLSFNPISIDNNGFYDFDKAIDSTGLRISLKENSFIRPSDLSSFAKQLRPFTDSIGISLNAFVSKRQIDINDLSLSTADNKFQSDFSGTIENLQNGIDADYSIDRLNISTECNYLSNLVERIIGNSINTGKILKQGAGTLPLTVKISAEGKINRSNINSRLSFAGNTLDVKSRYWTPDTFKTLSFSSSANVNFNDLTKFALKEMPTAVRSHLKADGRLASNGVSGSARLDSAWVTYNNHIFGPVNLTCDSSPAETKIAIRSLDPDIDFDADVSVADNNKSKNIDATVDIFNLKPSILGVLNNYPDYCLKASAGCNVEFSSVDDLSGYFAIRDISFSDSDSSTPDLVLKSIYVDAMPDSETPGLSLRSDYVNAYINGEYRFSTIVSDVSAMIAAIYPALSPELNHPQFSQDSKNNFSYNIKISECGQLCDFLHLPFSIIYPVEADGHMSSKYQTASLSLTSPYILQGDKIIENTMLNANLDAELKNFDLKASSKIPTKKGTMAVSANIKGMSDRIDNHIDWNIERKIPINGSFNLSALFSRNYMNQLATDIFFNPGSITFGDDVWSVLPSQISFSDKFININNFNLHAENKAISINGIISDNLDDSIDISLSNVALLDIFETLEIDKALIGGTATGDFTGMALLTDSPILYSDNLHVDNISYNRCVLGNADIKAKWQNDKQSFYLDAGITGLDGQPSHIFGDIFPMSESLDINFDINHAPVGFMKPFMEAFASDIQGYASGKTRLFGTFKYIDMTGDVFAEDLKLKIDFTNTWYSATDTIKLRPGVIDINRVVIQDINGHTAMLNGIVRHKYFKEPSFNFSVTNANDFLSYNVDSHQSPDWYGTIYGNGSATISGEPGVVNIGVKMSTAPKSVFHFVLSDRLDADEYSFITFKDSHRQAERDSISDNVPSIVRLLHQRLGSGDSDEPSAYNMNLQIDINPNARMVIVMDPVGGDEIKATGTGNMRLTYGSLNNDLKIYGTYVLNRGMYNFTLQDIIIKDFTIKEGSSIAFHGDPYAAQLNLEAFYSVNANLSDLDESFLLDKDLNRTNVPVHALLKVNGDMRQPDIDFDLEFPTLTQDTYRKVRSIVSTKDMMNRQIIYLLALNRFYTPDYMSSTTKGNELFSVASSTISSQLGNMLGKLSEDWSIAPNLRSDRGDFSDVEVDVALSSRLLNNRLLFNGNFGYRDKTLNTNQFIGDFDIEYLLNPKGSWRLKAYNRYNDQNYYVRTAQTTQGIGIVYKKDFDNFFGFLSPKKRKIEPQITPVESAPTIAIPDSIAHPTDPKL